MKNSKLFVAFILAGMTALATAQTTPPNGGNRQGGQGGGQGLPPVGAGAGPGGQG